MNIRLCINNTSATIIQKSTSIFVQNNFSKKEKLYFFKIKTAMIIKNIQLILAVYYLFFIYSFQRYFLFLFSIFNFYLYLLSILF